MNVVEEDSLFYRYKYEDFQPHYKVLRGELTPTSHATSVVKFEVFGGFVEYIDFILLSPAINILFSVFSFLQITTPHSLRRIMI